jgi:hypothetical protein
MEFGGAWCPNQQAAGLPTRANDRLKKARCFMPRVGASQRNGREIAEISVASPSNVKIVCEPFIVNMKNRRMLTMPPQQCLAAELNRRLSRKSIPLSPNQRK